MDIQQKTAAIATLANIVLTLIKFLLYMVSGSLAALSEAWHSLTDILTSFLVWLALRHKKSHPEPGTDPVTRSAAESGAESVVFRSAVTGATIEIIAEPAAEPGSVTGTRSAAEPGVVTSAGAGNESVAVADAEPGIVPDAGPAAGTAAPVSAGFGAGAEHVLVPSSRWRRWLQSLRNLATAEELASFLISVILLIVSCNLFHRLVFAEREPIANALASGIMFFLFGISSYMVFKFETRIGIEHQSVGLTSDGLHSKSDMIASLLTGISLITYHFGFDIDRPVGFFIALLVFFLAVEVLLMIAGNRFRAATKDGAKPSDSVEFTTYHILLSLFGPAWLHSKFTWFWQRVWQPWCKLPVLGFIPRHLRLLLLISALLAYAQTAIFVVGPGERGMLERFGALQRDRGLLEPGLHWKLPWPCEVGRVVDTESVRTLDIGQVAAHGERALVWARDHGDTYPFLSGDNNFLYPYLTLMYRVTDPVSFQNCHAEPAELVRRLCLRILTETVASKALYAIFTDARRSVTDLLQQRLQDSADRLQIGIQVLDVCLKDVHPPITVADAYEAVVSAVQGKQTMILEAHSHRNAELPNERGKAENLLQGAEVFRLRREHESRGESARFRMTEETFRQTQAITRQRLYFEAMSKALRLTKIMVVEHGLKSPDLFIDTRKISPFAAGNTEGPDLSFPEAAQFTTPESAADFSAGASFMDSEDMPAYIPTSAPPAQDLLPNLEELLGDPDARAGFPIDAEIPDDIIDFAGDD